MIRTEPYAYDHLLSHRKVNDRVSNPPRSYLRWLTDGYALEAPNRFHVRDLADDGDPAMGGEAAAYIGFHQDDPDRVRTACRVDRDGRFVTPYRCAIAQVRDDDERHLLGGLASNPLYPLDVTRLAGLPDWSAHHVVDALLKRLWHAWSPTPLPTRSRISDAQADAEAMD